MKPGLGQYRRHRRGSVNIRSPPPPAPSHDGGEGATGAQGCEFFRIPLLHHAEAAKLSLFAIEIAVVVGVAGNETVATDVVVGLTTFDHMHEEGQAGDPGFSVALVPQIELG